MANPYQAPVMLAANEVVWKFLVPAGVVMFVGTIVFGLLKPTKRKRSRRG